MRFVDELHDLSVLLEAEFGWSEDLIEISLPAIDGGAVVKALRDLVGHFRLPDDFAEVAAAFQLAGRELGVGFGWGERPMDYVQWVADFSTSLDEGKITVATNDPYFVVLDLESGRLFGYLQGAPSEAPIPLNIGFTQLILGAGNLSLCRTADDREELRRHLVDVWGSSADFWDSV